MKPLGQFMDRVLREVEARHSASLTRRLDELERCDQEARRRHREHLASMADLFNSTRIAALQESTDRVSSPPVSNDQ